MSVIRRILPYIIPGGSEAPTYRKVLYALIYALVLGAFLLTHVGGGYNDLRINYQADVDLSLTPSGLLLIILLGLAGMAVGDFTKDVVARWKALKRAS